jgi:tRNA(adenine34) deaminase
VTARAPDYMSSLEPAMRLALGQATSTDDPDVPVGAVVLDGTGTVVGAGRNRREADHDPTAHAEIVAIRRAAKALQRWRLDGHTLVVTLEPCTMCAGAALAARLNRLVYGAVDPREGAAGSLWDVLRDRRLSRRIEVIGGILEDECAQLLRDFFAQRREAVLAQSARPGRPCRVGSTAVESPSGRGRTPRKRVKGQPFRGFKSHLHREAAGGNTATYAPHRAVTGAPPAALQRMSSARRLHGAKRPLPNGLGSVYCQGPRARPSSCYWSWRSAS